MGGVRRPSPSEPDGVSNLPKIEDAMDTVDASSLDFRTFVLYNALMISPLRPPPLAFIPLRRSFSICSPSIPGGEHSFLFVSKMRDDWQTRAGNRDSKIGIQQSTVFGPRLTNLESRFTCLAPGARAGVHSSHFPPHQPQTPRFNRNSGYAKKFRENAAFCPKSARFAHISDSGPREIAHFQPQNRTFPRWRGIVPLCFLTQSVGDYPD